MAHAHEGDIPSLPPIEPQPEQDGPLSLLEAVLAWTMANLDQQRNASDDVLGPFLEVARQHAGTPFTADPIGTELVLAALRRQLGAGSFAGKSAGVNEAGAERQRQTQDRWRQVARQLAATIWEDPQAHPRLERFWANLVRRAT